MRGAVVPRSEAEGRELGKTRGFEELCSEWAGLPEGGGARCKDCAVGAGGGGGV